METKRKTRPCELTPEYKAKRNARIRARRASNPTMRERERQYRKNAPDWWDPNRAENNRRYLQRTRHKSAARRAVRKKVMRGKLPHPATLPCIGCGQPATAYHHHNGYDLAHRFDVVPVCPPCHGRAHAKD
jgi:hypothetical protein